MTYPQQPGPYGQYPQQPGPYGPGVPQQPQYGYPGGYGGHGAYPQGPPPPPPPRKKTGVIVGVLVSVVVVVGAVLVTGLAWPGWLKGSDGSSSAQAGTTTNAPVADEPEDLTTPETAAKALVQRLNRKDVNGIVRDLTCSGGKEKGSNGLTMVEDDLHRDLPPFDPKSKPAIRDVRAEFAFVKVTEEASSTANGTKLRQATLAVKFQNVPADARSTLRDHTGYVRLANENGQWLVCGLFLDGEASGSGGASGSGDADPNSPSAVLKAYVAAVNNKDQAGADKVTCSTGISVKPITKAMVQAGGQFRIERETATSGQESKVAAFELVGTAEGDTAKIIGSLFRKDANSPWCVNLLNIQR